MAGPLRAASKSPSVMNLLERSTSAAPSLLPLILYREYREGASVRELAIAFGLRERWVEEHIEAVRLCMERQIRVEARLS